MADRFWVGLLSQSTVILPHSQRVVTAPYSIGVPLAPKNAEDLTTFDLHQPQRPRSVQLSAVRLRL